MEHQSDWWRVVLFEMYNFLKWSFAFMAFNTKYVFLNSAHSQLCNDILHRQINSVWFDVKIFVQPYKKTGHQQLDFYISFFKAWVSIYLLFVRIYGRTECQNRSVFFLGKAAIDIPRLQRLFVSFPQALFLDLNK